MPNDAEFHEEIERLRQQATSAGGSVDESVPPEFTDEALALRFSDLHRDRLRYVAQWGKWLIREPTVWRFDTTLKAFDLSRAVCRVASAETESARVSAIVASAKTVAAVERLAKADRRHAATIDQWDADPWLLNTPAGVYDLRTGDKRGHRPDDYMTKITAVAPDGAGHCPLWINFLDRITNGDVELQAFLQRVIGYSLSGVTSEHALFFGYGTGGNGKGVFLNTVTAIMGDYAAIAEMATFTASTGDRHPADLAMLRGARLVTAQETEEGRHWAEARLKAITGGDPITARFMRQDYFTFRPQFKLFIAGNHKPGLRNVDEAIRRRLHLIPFTVSIPASERDPGLPDKLIPEWSGILQWMIDGCCMWYQESLRAPAVVVEATDDYLEDEDALQAWLNECCQVTSVKGATTRTAQLFESWKAWARAAGEDPGSNKRFSQNLEKKGYKRTRDTTNVSAFENIMLKPPPRSNTETEGDWA